MNDEIEEEAPRPRPLSGGIWTLFSWLRRTDRSFSSESISSVGSDRTVASFDFLAPIHYKDNPGILLPQIPETETYKKRLNERNLRRKYDRDITLRRKYGLFREEVTSFDGFSLPSKRLQRVSPTGRDRRATSEIFHRRAPYVPGKRRAPLPPQTVVSNTLPRSYKRKRQAPRPPVKFSDENMESNNIDKNMLRESKSTNTKYIVTSHPESAMQPENDLKIPQPKEVKLRSERSFLKQIFDNRKRNSAIDTSHVKLLPSISELDKQAAEIIATNKFLHGESSGHKDDNFSKLPIPTSSNEKKWICKLCYRKYDASIVSCVYCITSNKNKKIASNIYTQTDVKAMSSKDSEIDEKKKLKEMLKEMKDSLPKRPKHNVNNEKTNISSTETPTLRIGSAIENIGVNAEQSTNSKFHNQDKKVIESRTCNKILNLPSEPSTSDRHTDIFVGNSSKVTNQFRNPDGSINHGSHCDDVKMGISNSRKYNFLLGADPKPTNNLINKQSSDGLLAETNKNSVIIDKKTMVYNNEDKTKTTVSQQPQSSGLQIIKINKKSDVPLKGNRTDVEIVNTDNKSKSTKILKINQSSSNVQSKSCIKDEPKSRNATTEQSTEQSNKKTIILKETKMESVRLGDVISSENIRLNDTNKTVPDSKLNTPLRISSLLNPLYCPKTEVSNNKIETEILQTKPDSSGKNGDVNNTILSSNSSAASASKKSNEVHGASTSKQLENDLPSNNQLNTETSATKTNSNIDYLNLHAKRRDLINQLESAISKGDEKTAADAAANLAKLKLSCSVLSFSSQIVGLVKNTPNDANKIEKVAQDGNINAVKINGSKEVEKQHREQLTITGSAVLNNFQPSTSRGDSVEDMVQIEIWVEDKEAARGPIRMKVKRKAVMGDLKRQADAVLGLEIRLQRWIIGKNLCTNDDTPLLTLAGPDFKAPFYLCLVEPGTNKDDTSKVSEISNDNNKNVPNKINNKETGDVYSELIKLEQQALVPNTEDFECGVCIEQCPMGNGAVLRECIHTFCRECLSDVVRHSQEATVSCPAIGCPGTLQEREIRALLTPEEYDRWLARSLSTVESGTRNTFHCRTRDCTGWAFCEPGVRRFPCPVCKHVNCLPCKAVHENETCETYQARLSRAATVTDSNQTDEGTRALLDSLIAKGEALECPECSAIITKKWGCDWIKCSSCKTEICWVTKGRRWGPAGKGDTSDGCKCGVNGKRCHPLCGYCH
nr:uncharacterized protein LOC116779402 [Danaus plexippus plexippus]